MKIKLSPLVIVLICFMALVPSIPFWQGMTYAALPKLEEIRVALFINANTGYRNTVPSVTLSAPNGLKVGVREPDGVQFWLTEGPTLRSSLDQFRLKLLETEDANTAVALYNKLAGGPYEAYLFSGNKKGKTVYKVYAGSFSGKEEALAAAEKLKGDANTGPVVGPLAVEIAGPLHWNAGTYSSPEEAKKHQQSLQQKGLDAYLAYHENAKSQPVYSVWIGEAADKNALESLKQQALKSVPDLKLSAVDPKLPYLLVRDDLSPGEGVNASVPHLFFNADGQKVWIASVEGGIKVEERYGRVYRGQLELSQYNGKLAVINQVPFEEYLYSVVSSELSSAWPLEALKAQAVAARTYALSLGMKYGIAHVSDSTYEQVYTGMGAEFAAARQAVDETRGEVLADEDGLIEALYHSNAGGMTADPSEIWGSNIPFVKSIPSPDDVAVQGLPDWYRIILPDGTLGYIRSDLVEETGKKTALGLPVVRVKEDGVNVRPAPYVDNVNNAPLLQVNAGEEFVSIEKTVQANSFSWIRGPYDGAQLAAWINAALPETVNGELRTLEVTKTGPSGRALEIKANGVPLKVSVPDAFRTVFRSLPSTRFEIEETARVHIASAGSSRDAVGTKGLAVLDGSGRARAISGETVYVLNGNNEWRPVTANAAFRFIGYGFGHGLGLSQWGAKGLAELGYDYKQILQYYYKNVAIVKD